MRRRGFGRAGWAVPALATNGGARPLSRARSPSGHAAAVRVMPVRIARAAPLCEPGQVSKSEPGQARPRPPRASGDPTGGAGPPNTSDLFAYPRSPGQNRSGGRLRALAGPCRPPRPGVQRDRLHGRADCSLRRAGSGVGQDRHDVARLKPTAILPAASGLPPRPTSRRGDELPASIALAVASAL